MSDICTGSYNIDRVFTEKVVVITGGSSGIGKQVAGDLLRRGAYVIICSTEQTMLEEAHTELQLISHRIDSFVCDVQSTEQVFRLSQYVLERYRHIDILINNVGYAVYRPFEESSIEEIFDIVDINLFGAMRCAKVFLPNMIARRCGRIVNISSVGGEMIITPNAAYCAAKHGMVAWTKAIRYELAYYNISVNVVCPDYVRTNFQNHPTFRRRDVYRGKRVRSLTVKAISEKILDAIRRDRIVTFVPSWTRLIVWALNALPFITGPAWDRIMKKRVFQLYEQIEVERQGKKSV